MNLEKIEKELYNNQELLDKFEIMREENWKKAKPTERFAFINDFILFLADVDGGIPSEVGVTDLYNQIEKQVLVSDDCILLDRKLFERQCNPYDLLRAIVFKLCFYKNLCFSETVEAQDSEIGQRFIVNNSTSYLGNWTNFYDEKNENYGLQPMVYEASKINRKFNYNIVKYMHNRYGMDKFISKRLETLMINDFSEKRLKKEAEEFYKKMEQNYKLLDEEVLILQDVYNHLNSYDSPSDISDDDFYFVFSSKLISNFTMEERFTFYVEFLRRVLPNSKFFNNLINNITISATEEGVLIEIGENKYLANIYQELSTILDVAFTLKIHECILDEFDDDDFKLQSMECLEYIQGLNDGKNAVEYEYGLPSATPFFECKNYLFDYYYKKIESSIKNNKIYNNGVPALRRGSFSKYDAYLKFAFDKDYNEVRDEQFASLREDFEKKKGAKR